MNKIEKKTVKKIKLTKEKMEMVEKIIGTDRMLLIVFDDKNGFSGIIQNISIYRLIKAISKLFSEMGTGILPMWKMSKKSKKK